MDLEGEGKREFDVPSIGSDPKPNTWMLISPSELDIFEIIHAKFPYRGSSLEQEEWLWNLWEYFIESAQKLRPLSVDSKSLIDAIVKLQKVNFQTVKVFDSEWTLWCDLPLLGPCMREAWIDPTLLGCDISEQQIERWCNLNSFAAQLLGLRLVGWSNLALWQLRTALEQDGKFMQSRVDAAVQWLLYARNVLHDECKNSMDLDEASKQASAPGPRFHGESGFTQQRWDFWYTRLREAHESGITVQCQLS